MEFRDNQAIYLQIADYFLGEILAGKLQGEERIPSVRQVAVELEVNPNTVMRTYSYLQEKGVLQNKRGIGYFTTSDSYKHAKTMKRQELKEQELPQFFRSCKLLDVSPDDLLKWYSDYLSNVTASEK